jgi:hypothetical protein
MKKIIIFALFAVIASTTAVAQINTLYFNKNIYQSTELNPARQHNCKFSFGLPALSSIYIDLYNKNFAYKDFFLENTALPDTERFELQLDNFYNNLKDNNYLFLTNKTSLGYVAFWIRDFYVSFGANLILQQNIAYPKSMFIIKDGNYFEDDRFVSMTNMALQSNTYTETYLGVAKEVAPGLTIGGRIKLLTGYENLTLDNFQLDWHVSTADTDVYDYTFNLGYRLRSSSTMKWNIPSSIDDTSSFAIEQPEFTLEEPADFLSFKKEIKAGKGVGIDFGIMYKYEDKLEASASILDFGFINWKLNPISVEAHDRELIFSGADPGHYLGDLNIFDLMEDTATQNQLIDSVIKDYIDTVWKLTAPTMDTNKYKTNLNTKLNFAVAYTPAEWVTLGFMYNGLFFNKQLHSSYTLSSTLMFWRGWSYTLNYTMRTKSFNNIGMGFSYKIGPFQTYLLVENLSIPVFMGRYALSPEKPYNEGLGTKWIKSTKLLNFQFGINFMFGCRDRRDFGLID